MLQMKSRGESTRPSGEPVEVVRTFESLFFDPDSLYDACKKVKAPENELVIQGKGVDDEGFDIIDTSTCPTCKLEPVEL